MGSHEGSQQYQEMQNSHLISLIVSCFPGNFGLSLVVLKLAEWKLTDIEWLHLTHWFKEMAQYISPTTLQTPPPPNPTHDFKYHRSSMSKQIVDVLFVQCLSLSKHYYSTDVKPLILHNPPRCGTLSAGSDTTTSRLQIINPHNGSSSRTKNVKAVCPVNHNELRGGTGVQGSMGRGQGLVFQTNAITFL